MKGKRSAIGNFGFFSFMLGFSIAYAVWTAGEGLWLLFPVFVFCTLIAVFGAWNAWRHIQKEIE